MAASVGHVNSRGRRPGPRGAACVAATVLAAFPVARLAGEEGLAERSSVAASTAPFDWDRAVLEDVRGKPHRWSDYRDRELVVLAFLGVECPLAKLYAPRLQRLADEYADRGVAFLAVHANVHDSLAEIAAFAARHELQMPALKDAGNRLADALQVSRTPEAVVLDRHRNVCYRGRIDDQYGVGVVRSAPTREDLREAIDALLEGRIVEAPATEAVGCLVGRVRKSDPNAPVTYRSDIAPLLERACVACHREGEIAPFALTTYEEASGWGAMIAEVVRQRRMPPWHASPAHGAFANDRSLSEAERDLIAAWEAAGCPEGTGPVPAATAVSTPGWQLPRQPDQVFAMAEQPFAVPAEAGPQGVAYQYFRVPTGFAEDRWVAAAEVQPGDRQTLHHSIVYADPPDGRGRRDWIFVTAYVPGLRFDPLPPGAAKRVPAGSTLIFEQHYTPIGSPQYDVTRIGLIYADPEEVAYEAATVEIGDAGFEIPPHAPCHPSTATSRPFERPLTLVSLSPHMHVRGKSFVYELVMPDGRREVLLDVPRYDFNWQTRYVLAEPRELPAGAVIHCRAAFDNSTDNLANPNPDAVVRWGEQSWDEMMLGYFDVMLPRSADPDRRKWVDTGLDAVGEFDRSDRDGDGFLTAEEAARQERLSKNFDQVDADDDDRISLAELLHALRRFYR